MGYYTLFIILTALFRINGGLNMYKDKIISEVWQNRDAYVKKHHHNLNEIVKDLQKRQKKHSALLIDKRKSV